MKVIEKDHMPYPVATSLMTEPKATLSNRMRKNCRAAREVVLVSEVVAQPLEGKLDRRMKLATGKQLLTWSKRATERRRILQRHYEELTEQLPMSDAKKMAQLKHMLEALSAAVKRLDTYKDACDDEYRRRTAALPRPEMFLHPRRFRTEIPQH